MAREQIATMVDELDDIVAVLSEGDPTQKCQVYQRLGLELTYHPTERGCEAPCNSTRGT